MTGLDWCLLIMFALVLATDDDGPDDSGNGWPMGGNV